MSYISISYGLPVVTEVDTNHLISFLLYVNNIFGERFINLIPTCRSVFNFCFFIKLSPRCLQTFFFLARSQQRLVTNIFRRNPPPNPYREKQQLFAAKDKKVLMNVTQMQNPFLFFTRLQLWCQNSFTSRKWS